mmetsp:Transcript_35811/g.55711  ORF Transcript_35811/g.55711 Transcript_35811/m.55711 type:complete len:86 (+) Transcript_35811:1-258(+)
MLFALVPIDQASQMGGIGSNMPQLVGAGPLDGTNWHNEDEPWGAFLQGPGNPAGPRLSNPQGHTTWVPVDNESWPNYNVHGYGTY